MHAGWCGRVEAAAPTRAGVPAAASDDPFGPYLAKVALYCLRRTRDPQEAAALAERALARARRKIASSRDAGSFSVWLYSIVREECLSSAPPRDVPLGAAEEVP